MNLVFHPRRLVACSLRDVGDPPLGLAEVVQLSDEIRELSGRATSPFRVKQVIDALDCGHDLGVPEVHPVRFEARISQRHPSAQRGQASLHAELCLPRRVDERDAMPGEILHVGTEPEHPNQVDKKQNHRDGGEGGHQMHQLRTQRPFAEPLLDRGPVNGLVVGSQLRHIRILHVKRPPRRVH